MADAPAQESELWLVSVGPGDTRRMTLDQLDQAFSDGMIDETTMLCEVGTEDWQPLYVVAGLEPPARVTAPGSPAPPHSPPAAASPNAPTEPEVPTHSYRAPAPTEIGPPTAANFAVPDQSNGPNQPNVDVDSDDAETEITKLPSEKEKQAAVAHSASATSSSSAGAFKVPTPGQPHTNALGVPRPAGMRVPGAGLSRAKVGGRKSGGFRVPTPDAPAQALPGRSNPPQAGVSPLTAKPLSSRPPAPAASSSAPAAPRSVAPPLPASFTSSTAVSASGPAVAAPQADPTTTKTPALDSPFSGMPVASVKRPGESSPETPAAQTEIPTHAEPEHPPAAAEVAPAPAAPLDVSPEAAVVTATTSAAPSAGAAAPATPSVTPPHDPALGVPAPTPGGPQSKAPPLPSNAFAHLSSPPAADSSAGLSNAPVAPGVTPSHAPINPAPMQVVGQPVATAQPVASAASALTPNSLAPGSTVSGSTVSGPPPAAAVGLVNPSAPPMVAASVPAQVDADLDDNPFAKPKAAGMGRAEKLVLAAACLLSLLLILNRNGILFGIAKSMGAESTYTSIDGALGGPSMNTERGVQQFVERIKSSTNAPQTGNSP